MAADDPLREYARMVLAGIRILNGALALLAPGFLARRLGIDPDKNPGVLYVFRMFGIRTVLIGADLLAPDSDRRKQALGSATLIHASDTLAALLATRSSQFPKQGRLIVWISAANTALAVIANR